MSSAHRLARRVNAFTRREGGKGTLRIQTGTSTDSQRNRTAAYTDYPVRVLFLGRVLARDQKGAQIETDAIEASIPGPSLPAGVAPGQTSLLVVGSVTYRVKDVEIVSPDDATTVSYELQLLAVKT